MSSYRLTIDCKPGKHATLDEFAAERVTTSFEDAKARGQQVEVILRARYPGSDPRVYAVSMFGLEDDARGDPLARPADRRRRE